MIIVTVDLGVPKGRKGGHKSSFAKLFLYRQRTRGDLLVDVSYMSMKVPIHMHTLAISCKLENVGRK